MKENNFWKYCKRPIIAAAPMEDVTDTVFRTILLQNSGPGSIGAVFTEFVPTDGLCHDIGRDNVSHRLDITPEERKLLKQNDTKIIVQLWGSDPEKFRKSVLYIDETRDFDGFDINMGCPMKRIIKQNGGAALIGEPNLAKEIVHAVRDSTPKPVSVKTRTGLDSHNTEEWIGTILETSPDAVTLHGRTRKMMYKGKADREEIRKARDIIKRHNPDIAVIGNGDIESLEEARNFCEEYKTDGAMIGRALLANPFIFSGRVPGDLSNSERLRTMLEHARYFKSFWGDEKNYNILKKFFKAYTLGMEHAAEMRGKFMNTSSPDELAEAVADFHKI